MDPIWLATAAELWWVAPAVAGAGAAGFVTVRRFQTVNGKRLGYDAARLELRQAQADAREAANAARVARADAARVVADRAASRADTAAVASARRAARDAQLTARAASARVRAGRARVAAERSALASATVLPLDRMRGRHDAVLGRWMEYETDPAKMLAHPAMSDGRQPATAAFFAAVEAARDLRPGQTEVRVTAADFAAYRRAVEALEHAFDLAERSARGERMPADPLPEALRDAARTIMDRSAEVLGRTTDILGSWNARRKDR
ncbi:hypothetical protein ACFWHT_03805 [Microbacterium sp. NPDC058342]|uniref:hypothetical protein n=1 Tax=Microbacterium sp. NPDC058342 TaxID=3346454 RepID=UPI00364709AF